MTTYLLGVDIGTSAIKLGLITPEGQLIETASVSQSFDQPRPGWTETPPEKWWKGLIRGVDILCERRGVKKDSIASIGFSVLYPALIPMDANLNPLRPAILYSDQRSIAQLSWLKGILDMAEFVGITANGVSTGTCSLTSMLWIKENEPEIFEKAEWFGHANTYVVAKLTGNVAMEWTNASLTGLFEAGDGRRWSERFAAQTGIPLEKMPPLVSSGELVGYITKEAAAATGLKEETPVAAGAGDTTCSALGAGLLESGEIMLTCGTTDNLSACTDTPKFDARFANCHHTVPNRWLAIATMSNTGACIEWFKDKFTDVSSLPADADVYEHIFSKAENVPPGSDGLIFLPYLHGERSPIWDAHAKGVFFGLSLTTDKWRMFRAILEGTAFALRQNFEAIESLRGGGEIEDVLVVGGGSKSRVWNQIRADVTGKSFTPLEFGETSLLGAALLGGVAAGIYRDCRDAVAGTRLHISLVQPVHPNASAHALYTELFDIYKDLYPSLKDKFQQMAEIREKVGSGSRQDFR